MIYGMVMPRKYIQGDGILSQLHHYVSLCDISFIESFNRSSKAYGHVLLGEYSKSCYIKKSSDSFNLLVFLAGEIG